MLSLVKLAGTDQRYYLEQAQGRVDRVGSMASGAEDYFLSGPEAAGEWIGSAAPLLGCRGSRRRGDAPGRPDAARPGLRRGPARARQPRARAGLRLHVLDPQERVGAVRDRRRDDAARDPARTGPSRRGSARTPRAARLPHAAGQGRARRSSTAPASSAPRSATGRAAPATRRSTPTSSSPTRPRRPDGKWGTLDGRALFAEARTAGYVHEAVFRHELTRELGVEWGPVRKGIADIEGVPQRVIRAFSRRRAEVQAKVAEWGRDGLVARQTAAQVTRARKDYDVTPDQLAPEWRARAAELGLSGGGDAGADGRRDRRASSREAERAEIVASAHRPTGLTSQRSTFDRRDLTRAVAEASRAGATLEQLARWARTS